MNDEALRLANEVRNWLGNWDWCPFCGGGVADTYHGEYCALGDLLGAVEREP